MEDKLYIGLYISDYNINNIPKHVEHILLGNNFISKLDNLPNNIKKITFLDKCEYNYSLDNLPDSINYIKFGFQTNYNLPLDNLPNNLKHLSLPSNYNHYLNKLPDSIEELILNENYNLPINKYPKNLKKIYFGNKYNHELINFPNRIEYLRLGQDYNYSFNIIPFTVKELILNCNKKENILSLLSFGYFNKYYKINILPCLLSLEYLYLSESFEFNLNEIPINIKTLEFYYDFSKAINIYLINLQNKYNKSRLNIYNESEIKKILLKEIYDKIKSTNYKIYINFEYSDLNIKSESSDYFTYNYETDLFKLKSLKKKLKVKIET